LKIQVFWDVTTMLIDK